MAKNTKKIIIYAAILCGFIFLSTCIVLIPKSGIPKDISGVLSVASSLTSLITLLIAFILLNKFGIETDVLKKNLDIVSRVFEILARTRIIINTKDHGDSWHFISLLRDLREGRLSEFSIYAEKIVAIDRAAASAFDDLIILGENIFMPREIAACIRKLNVEVISFNDDINKNPKKYAFIQYHQVNALTNKSDVQMGLFNAKEIKLEQHLKMFDDLYTACKKWLKINSSINLDLNL